MTLNDYFDAVYLINLDEATDRLDASIIESKLHNFTFKRFSAFKLNTGNEYIVRGNLGLLYSNIEIIKNAKENNFKKILILEDDFDLIDDFSVRFEEYINSLPQDWDMLYFGGNHLYPPTPVNNYFSKVHHTYTTHMIGLNSNMYDVILEVLPRVKKPIDVYYAELQKTFNVYTFTEYLASQRPGFSYIEETHVEYNFLKK